MLNTPSNTSEQVVEVLQNSNFAELKERYERALEIWTITLKKSDKGFENVLWDWIQISKRFDWYAIMWVSEKFKKLHMYLVSNDNITGIHESKEELIEKIEEVLKELWYRIIE